MLHSSPFLDVKKSFEVILYLLYGYCMHGLCSLTTLTIRESYLIMEGLGGSFNGVASLPQIRSGLATAIESEAGATKIISEDDLGHEF